MQTRSLGRTDLRLTELTLGTWGLAAESYGPVAAERFDETVKSAIEKGIRAFDVAPVWGKDGDSERRIAKLVKDAKIDAVIISRAGARRGADGKIEVEFTKDKLIADCEGSLSRLEREHVDIWLLHGANEAVLREREQEWRGAIDKLEQDGKIRAWGASVAHADEARLAIGAGAQALCLTHNLLNAGMLDDLSADITAGGCGVLVRSALQYGLLAGQWAEDRTFPKDDHRAQRWSQSAFSERIKHVDELRFLVGARHRDLATASYRFVLHHGAVTSVIVGARSPYQVTAATESASGAPYMTDDDMARLGKIRGEYR